MSQLSHIVDRNNQICPINPMQSQRASYFWSLQYMCSLHCSTYSHKKPFIAMRVTRRNTHGLNQYRIGVPPRPWSQNLLPPEGLNILCIMYYTVTRQQSLKPFIDHQNKHFWLEQILMVRVPVSPAHRVSTVGFYIFLRLHNCVPVIFVLL